MHGSNAAGTAIEAKVEDDGRTFFGAHVVDPIAVKKVETNVYKGFSIGGRVTERDSMNKALITGLKLIEVSLVDRPANPEAVFTCYKAELLPEELSDREAVSEMARMLDAKELTPQTMVKAAKAATAPAPEKPTLERLRKGMSGLCEFAALLSNIAWLTQATADEAAWEGDGSALPQQLHDWLASGLMIFESMTTEEVDELLAQTKPKESAAAPEIVKAAEEPAPEPEAKIEEPKVEEPAAAAPAQEPAAAAVSEAEPEPKAAAAVVTPDAVEALVKAAMSESSARIEGLLTKVSAMEKQIAEFRALPAPGKALLKAIGKGEDIDAAAPLASTTPASPPADASPLEIMKAVHARGGLRIGA
jgi:hypothetical protein